MHTVKGFQVLLFNTNSFICTHLNSFKYCTLTLSFICTQLSGFKFRKLLNRSIWPIDVTQIGTTTPGQSGPGNNGYEGVLYIPQNSLLELDHQMQFSVISRTLVRGILLLCKDAIGIFYSPIRLGCQDSMCYCCKSIENDHYSLQTLILWFR